MIAPLPDSCPIKSQLYEFRDYLLGLNEEIVEKFGPGSELSVQRISPKSIQYIEYGLRWFIILPWPKITDETLDKYRELLKKRIKLFEELTGFKSFGYEEVVAGGALTIIMGLRAKPV
jgi:hypothetical protein